MSYLTEIGIVALLILLNGWFAMSELAVVSARRPRLEVMAAQGNRGARAALLLSENPGRFLSSTQLGITLVGILAGAYSGATLAEPLGEFIASKGMGEPAASILSIAVVVGGITYFSLVVGELVPKHIALSNPERIASMVAIPMTVLASATSPAIHLFDLSSRIILKVLRLDRSSDNRVTEEEIRAVIAEGTKTGILEPEEKELMAGVLRFGDRSIRAIMTPRRDVIALDLEWPPERVREALTETTHSRYPVYRGSIDSILGLVQAKDLLDSVLSGEAINLEKALKPVEVVPDSAPALNVLELLRRSPIHVAVVVDEYGSVEGIVTAADILAALVGSVASTETEASAVFQREDGSWLADADLPVSLVAERVGNSDLDDPDRDYETLAGLVLAISQEIPSTGDVLIFKGWRFEVVDMDGRRIDKVLITAPGEA
jgi:putative hemolysin